jgi:hypothetical protein
MSPSHSARKGLSMLTVVLSACVGCGNGGGGSSASTSSTSPTASATSSTTSSGSIGVPECDEYVARMRACNENAPAAERSQRASVVDQIESTWKQQAQVADTKSRLPTTCKASLEALGSDAACKK